MAHQAMERATELVLEICGGTASEINETVDEKSLPKLEPIEISIDKISKVLGFDLDSSWVESKFKFLDFDFKKNQDDSWTIIRQVFVLIFVFQQTSLRSLLGFMDTTRFQFKDSLSMPIYRRRSQAKITSNDLSNALVHRGYQEVITYSFISNEMHDLVDSRF